MAMEHAIAPPGGEAAQSKAPDVAPTATVRAKLAFWFDRVRSHAFWVQVRSPSLIWRGTIFVLGWAYALVSKLPIIIAIVVIGTIIVQGLTQHATVVNPISVPKELADRGYTPDVAGHRLRDAMTEYTNRYHSSKKNPEVALSGDQPTIVVPTVGISLDAVVSSMRTLLRSTRSRSISGEITVRESKLWLRLRLDGVEFYTSKTGAEIDKPDDLFSDAVQDVLTEISPYFVAVALQQTNPDAAKKFVDEEIAKLPAGSEDLPWLYNSRGIYYQARKDYPAAMQALQTAIKLNDHLAAAHVNLGSVYRNENKNDLASAEFHRAI
jgi:hypothetical protein